jgi:hypothetical protein
LSGPSTVTRRIPTQSSRNYSDRSRTASTARSDYDRSPVGTTPHGIVLERLPELVAGDCSLHEVAAWTVVEEAQRYTTAQWADVRGVTESAVRSNVNAAREKHLTEEDRESLE